MRRNSRESSKPSARTGLSSLQTIAISTAGFPGRQHRLLKTKSSARHPSVRFSMTTRDVFIRCSRGDQMSLNFRSRRFGTLISVLWTLFFACSSHAENIKIGLPSVTITAMPFFVAKEYGFFQQEGLTAEMVVMPASLNIKVLLAGDIQYAATIGSAVAASMRGINVRTVMLFVDQIGRAHV